MAAVVSDVDLRAPSHGLRYVVIVVGCAVLGGGLWGFNHYSAKEDQSKLSRFDAFRAAYAEKCNVPSYAGPVAEVLRDDYLTSPAIQLAVDKELVELNKGAACADVVQALKKVDLAIPVASGN